MRDDTAGGTRVDRRRAGIVGLDVLGQQSQVSSQPGMLLGEFARCGRPGTKMWGGVSGKKQGTVTRAAHRRELRRYSSATFCAQSRDHTKSRRSESARSSVGLVPLSAMPPSRTPSDPGRGKGKSTAADSQQDKPTKVKPVDATKGAVDSTLLLPFQASVLQQLVPPENAAPSTGDALLIMARGLGLRTVVTTFVSLTSRRASCGGSLSRSPCCDAHCSSRSTTCPRSSCSL